MANAVRFHETGGPNVLKYESVAVPPPGPGEVHIRHAAVGINYADTYFRTGYDPAPMPNGMGVEAAGTILAVGTGVDGFAAGDRVTYTGSPLGAYSTERVMPTASLIKLPETISGILRCPNPNCISNHERVETRFHVENAQPIDVRCHYCERRIREGEVVLR